MNERRGLTVRMDRGIAGGREEDRSAGAEGQWKAYRSPGSVAALRWKDSAETRESSLQRGEAVMEDAGTEGVVPIANATNLGSSG